MRLLRGAWLAILFLPVCGAFFWVADQDLRVVATGAPAEATVVRAYERAGSRRVDYCVDARFAAGPGRVLARCLMVTPERFASIREGGTVAVHYLADPYRVALDDDGGYSTRLYALFGAAVAGLLLYIGWVVRRNFSASA